MTEAILYGVCVGFAVYIFLTILEELAEYFRPSPAIDPNYNAKSNPEPKLGMTEEEVDAMWWTWLGEYTTTTTETEDGICIVRYYPYKGKLTFENGILTKIVRFD
jgi:hypothetical protein